MPRFYIPSDLSLNSCFSLPEKVVRHVQVLRYQPGDVIELFDGSDRVYQAEIIIMGKKNVDVRLLSSNLVSLESPLKITLIQSVSSSERMDLTVQKSVELGINAIQPVITERSSKRFNHERALKKQERWREIAISACEQCGRTKIPEIRQILNLAEYLTLISATDLKLLMSLNQPKALNQLAQPQAVSLLIGPEGGLTKNEELLAMEHGFQAISLGPRVLRTETASLAAISAMQMLWGDFALSSNI